ncbi:hypothetical protein [Cryobacterium sp. N22]|uniref:hypothetical protein n=1 Tax=Cryobacterium sp. N22 TaxID=2048290 RepID=UPI0011B05594|nr:hypothetical protein [Cryobacterium sp. N22]
MSAVSFVELPSGCTVPGSRASQRADVYWAGVWEQGATAAWLSADLARRQSAAGFGRIPTWLDVGPGRVQASIRQTRRRDARLNAMSVIDSWRTVTGEQMAAISGDAELGGHRSTVMGELFGAGVADIGSFNTGLADGKSAGSIYRPSRTPNFDREISGKLTYPEWVSVTAGHPWESGSQYDRHNILAAELALRVAEWCEIGAVVGEKLSTLDLLAHSGAGLPRPTVGVQKAADATLIRTDGARIAVEITASTGKSFDAKVRRWAELLANRRMRDTGLAVVFVVATRPDKLVNTREVRAQVLRAVARAARDYPGVNFDRTASRMFVADWRDWFPAAGKVDMSFLTLECQRPTGPASALWQQASLLDTFDLEFLPTDSGRALAVIDNLSFVRSVPHWLRTGTSPALWPLAVTALGFTGIPVPELSATQAGPRMTLGAGKGAAGQTRVPRRLLG